MSPRHLLAVTAALTLAACGTRGEQRAARTDKALPSMAAAKDAPRPAHTEVAVFGMGCFWGAEEHFYGRPGVIATSVGYAGGHTADPTYEKVSSHTTGHAEVVRVEFDPARISYDQLLRIFWEQHDPTQGDRQGNDVGDSYRSAIYAYGPAQLAAAKASRDAYQRALSAKRYPAITTEIREAPEFYPAEPFHQQYCIRNPEGYCGHGGTGVEFPMSAALR